MQLVVRKPANRHVSHDTVEELEQAILRDFRVAPATLPRIVESVADAATRFTRKAGLNPGRLFGAHRRHSPEKQPRHSYFAVMMDLDAARFAPWFARNARKSVYMFDAWPAKHREILNFVDSWGVQYAFVSSSEAATRLNAVSEHCTFIWVAEGVDAGSYRQNSVIERDIDVLQLGRKHDTHHSLIAPALEAAGKVYLYEKEKGSLVFPSRRDFIDGLSRTKISICVPSSVTHPERAGDIETMTTRYLQSMASKCLVLGHAPAEMIELFGYNPVVEIDGSAPAEQVLDLLADYESCIPLIEKNYAAVTAGHTWAHRWERMATVLFPP
jgi:hypothetical protein